MKDKCASLNEPVSINDCLWEVGLHRPMPWPGVTFFLNRAEVERYNADPDRFAADHFGFALVADYREWVETDGRPLCSERTRSGALCRNGVTGGGADPDIWRRRHRSEPCAVHERAAP
jgi:hypothetical protein